MDNITYVGISRANSLRRELDVVANNIANANTTGFKADKMIFAEYVEKFSGVEDAARSLSFTEDKMTFVDLSAGSITRTGNALDIAIQGDGFYAYQLDDGSTGYGRDGRFLLGPDGTLITSAGLQLLDQAGVPIALPPELAGEVMISADGSISDQNGNQLAQVGIFDVPNIQGLEKRGNGIYADPDPQFVLSQTSSVAQGFVENSNVEAIVELTRMMEVQRAYGNATKLMENADELTKSTISRLARSAG